MCGECNGTENVEPSEDLNMVNVHDGTWRRVEIGDTIQAGDHWEESNGRLVETTIPGHRLTIDARLWRRIPEHERTPVQQSTELPVPPDGYRWAIDGEAIVSGSVYCGPNGAILWQCYAAVGQIVNGVNRCGGFYAIPENTPLPVVQTERIPYADDGTWRRLNVGETMRAFDWWEFPPGRFNPCDEREDKTLTNDISIVWRRDPNAKPPEPIVPIVVSEDDDSRPVEQRKLDSMLRGVRSGCLTQDGKRYETALETMARLYPNGYGIDEHGALFSLGFTGKRKAMTIGQLKESLNWSYSSGEFITLLQQLGKQFPPKIKTAHGDDIQDVFEKYRPGSCMSGCGCRDMRSIYACNPESIGVVYSIRDTSTNPLIESSCSALFWIGSKRIYLDRMYSSGAANTYVQYDWFADNLETVYGKPCVPIYTSTKQRRQYEKTITFKLKDSGNALPYIDSLYTVKKYDGEHVWLTSDESAGDIHCRDTAGTYPDGRDRCQCSECGCRMDEDDARHHGDETYCGDCYSDQFTYCEWTEEDYPTDEVHSVECWCYGSRYRERCGGTSRNGYALGWHTLSISDSALESYFTELSDGRYASNGNTVEDNRGNVHASDCDSWDNVTLTEDGDLYHVDDVVQLSDGRTYPADDCVEVDGEWYLSGDEPEQEADEDTDEVTSQKEMVTE